jgi:7-carboxy-7-deazaguanine synthase
MHCEGRTVTAPVAEIFSSVQGEGPFVGVRQVFVRTYGCDLCCRYCDTPASRAETGPCRVESPPGSRQWRDLTNPLSAQAVAELIAELDHPPGLHHSVSLTGGEPLLHPEFVAEVAGSTRERGLQTYLETNGQRVAELQRVIDHIDIISMDVKLPSSQMPDCEFDWDALLARSMSFLRLARSKHVFAKMVVTPLDAAVDVERVASRIAGEAPEVTLVLQPVTPAGDVDSPPTPEAMLRLQALAARHLPDVRIIPQCHRLMDQL